MKSCEARDEGFVSEAVLQFLYSVSMLALKPGSCQPYGTISIILAIRKTFMEMTKQEMVRKVKTGQSVLLRYCVCFIILKVGVNFLWLYQPTNLIKSFAINWFETLSQCLTSLTYI